MMYVPVTLLVAYVVIGGAVLAFKLRLLEAMAGSNSVGTFQAEVLHSAIRETEIFMALHIRAKIASEEEFYVVTQNHSLYAIAGQKICVEVFAKSEHSVRRAGIIAFDKCAPN